MSKVPDSTVCYRGIPLDHISNFDASPEGGGVTPKRTLTPKRKAVAFINGQFPNYRLSWSFMDQQGGNEVDWHGLWLGQTEFDMSRHNDAYTNSWDPVRIDSISESTDENGVTVYNVDAVALDVSRF